MKSKARIPVSFKIVSFEAVNVQLPDGRTLEQPKHYRLLGPDGAIVASGPWEHEGTMQIILACAGEFMRRHTSEVRQIIANKTHLRVSIPLEVLKQDGPTNRDS